MTLRLYTLSGSPFGWKTQLALAFKRIAHELTYLSSDKGDLDAPGFRALNPHGKAPVLVDGEFALFESDVIIEYLEDAFPGPGLWPSRPQPRALARRIVAEASAYLYPPIRALVTKWSTRETAAESVDEARPKISSQLDVFARLLTEPYFSGGKPGAADFAVYPLVALIERLDGRRPEMGLAPTLPGAICEWSRRIEAMPGFSATYPPHRRSSP